MDGETPTPSLHEQSIQGPEIEATCCANQWLLVLIYWRMNCLNHSITVSFHKTMWETQRPSCRESIKLILISHCLTCISISTCPKPKLLKFSPLKPNSSSLPQLGYLQFYPPKEFVVIFDFKFSLTFHIQSNGNYRWFPFNNTSRTQ